MLKQRLVLALSFAAFAVTGSFARETHLKERDHQALGKLVGAYFEAKRESEGIAEALAKIAEEVAKIDKKSKDLPFLAMVEDVQQALYYSAKYKESVTKGKLDELSMDGAYGVVNYSLHAPKSYKASKGPYPLVICLPDVGQTPQQHFDENWADAGIREEMILAICQLPEDKNSWATLEGGIAIAMQVLGVVRREYAVDVDRTYLAARGAALPAAMAIGQNYPHLFAGVIGRAGDVAEGTSPANFSNLPVLFAGGGANCTAFDKAAKDSGLTTCTISPDATEADVHTWINEHQRIPHPAKVTFAPTTQFGKSAYWLLVDGFDPADMPRVDATADRTTNSIDVSAKEIGSVRIYLNDVIVDLGKPINIVMNGQPREVKLPRSLEHTLDQAALSRDTGRAYTNSYYFEVSTGQE